MKSMEEMLVQAVRKFKRENKNAEFRTCYASESYGSGNKYEEVTFRIEYVEEDGGEYKEVYVTARA